jgi:NAD(P)-dependent dehydrogenase (short-subunit alcohol dehydrogenase family)
MLAQRSGQIVTITSLAGKKDIPYQAAYAASKAGPIVWTSAVRISRCTAYKPQHLMISPDRHVGAISGLDSRHVLSAERPRRIHPSLSADIAQESSGG